MLRQEGAESLDGVLAMARDGEDHRLLLALHVEEHREVAMTPSRSRLVHSDSGHTG